jgi:hypothetical protein
MRSGHSVSVGVRAIIVSAATLKQRRSLSEYVALADRAAHSANLNRGNFDMTKTTGLLHDILASLSSIDNGGFAACAIQFDSKPTRTAR